jgi:ProQ/FINO family
MESAATRRRAKGLGPTRAISSARNGGDSYRARPHAGRPQISNMTNSKGTKHMTQSNAAPTIKRPTLTLARSPVRPARVAGVPGRPVEVVTVRAVRPDKAPPAKAVKPPTPSTKPAKASPAKPAKTKPIWIRPLSKDAIANRERSRQTHLELVRRFPACFGEPVKPLAMGIDAQLFEACPDIDRHALMFLLGEYTSTADYHRAMIAGPDRVDLNGVPVGAVTLSSVAYAKHRLKLCLAAAVTI